MLQTGAALKWKRENDLGLTFDFPDLNFRFCASAEHNAESASPGENHITTAFCSQILITRPVCKLTLYKGQDVWTTLSVAVRLLIVGEYIRAYV